MRSPYNQKISAELAAPCRASGRSAMAPAILGAVLLGAGPAFAADPPVLSAGDTAWMLTSTVLVLMMLVPGLALFYAGMVRKMNVLATLMQSFACMCLISIVWFVIGYSIAFAEGTAFVGSLSKMFLGGVEIGTLSGTIPETLFFMFQLSFAAITPALIFGAVADRMRFSAMLLFSALWSIVVYAPSPIWSGVRAASSAAPDSRTIPGPSASAPCSILRAAPWSTSIRASRAWSPRS